MRTLLVLRHGEAASSSPEGRDATRSLTAAGRRACEAVAEWLTGEGLRPDRVLCSPATRARETLEIVVAGLPGLDVRYQDDLYLASRPTLVASLAGVDPEVQTLLLVGHNPGLAELAAWLDPDVRPPLTLAPAALAVFELRVDDWSDLASGAAELRAHL